MSHDVRVNLPVGFSSNLFFTEFFFFSGDEMKKSSAFLNGGYVDVCGLIF